VDWVARRNLVERLADDRLRELGKRLIFVERPDVMDAVEQTELETWTMDRLFGFGPEGPRSLDESYQEACRLIETEGHEQQSLLMEISTWLFKKLESGPWIEPNPSPQGSLGYIGQDQEVEV
jgi:exodeoxyribonuclease I